MNKLLYFIAFLGLLAVACSVSTPENMPISAKSELENAPEFKTVHVMATWPLNVRQAASTESASLGYVNNGDVFTVIGYAVKTPADGRCREWLPIEWKRDTAYVCAFWVEAK